MRCQLLLIVLPRACARCLCGRALWLLCVACTQRCCSAPAHAISTDGQSLRRSQHVAAFSLAAHSANDDAVVLIMLAVLLQLIRSSRLPQRWRRCMMAASCSTNTAAAAPASVAMLVVLADAIALPAHCCCSSGCDCGLRTAAAAALAQSHDCSCCGRQCRVGTTTPPGEPPPRSHDPCCCRFDCSLACSRTCSCTSTLICTPSSWR